LYSNQGVVVELDYQIIFGLSEITIVKMHYFVKVYPYMLFLYFGCGGFTTYLTIIKEFFIGLKQNTGYFEYC